MTIRFSIGRRIGLGFASFILLTMVAFILTIYTLSDSKTKTETVVGQITPSVAELKELNLLLQRSNTDISKWYYNKSFNDIDFRKELKNIINTEYPNKKEKLNAYTKFWSKDEIDKLKVIFNRIESLFNVYRNDIMDPLSTPESYEDPNINFMVRLPYEESEGNIKIIYKNLTQLIDDKQRFAEDEKGKMISQLDFLKNFVLSLGGILIIGGILIAIFTTRSITIPISVLKKMLLSMGLGILPTERIKPRTDEVGEMGKALNDLIRSMQHTTDFARETGAGNFEAAYTPLSKDDALGHALLKMRVDLAENERLLEQKVIERTEEVVRQKSEIESKNEELEILYKQVTDSIHYAKRIQDTILPPMAKVKRLLPDSFILFKPKDIVSGDFFWIEEKGELAYFAAVDCTGHGVPGAFMSLVGYNVLKDIIKNTEATKPGEILDAMREGIINTMTVEGAKQAKDGMDITLCAINYKKMELQYAAAFNPMCIVRNGELIQFQANKFPVGAFVGDRVNFDNHLVPLQKGDQIFIFSDGYADQFGGPSGKKFMVGNFRKLLASLGHLESATIREKLDETLLNWQGSQEQVDDVLVIGVKV